MELCLLQPSDSKIIERWLHSFLKQHLKWWAQTYHLNWDNLQIEDHIKENNLVDTAFSFFLEASQKETDFIRTLNIDSQITGVIHAQITTNKLINFHIGRIQWIWIEPEMRGAGYGKMLIQSAHNWLSEKEIIGADLFVNSNNQSAVSLYKNFGYEVSDLQMLISKESLNPY